MYMRCTDIASNSPVLVTPPRPHVRQLSASQDLVRPLPPRCLPHRPPTSMGSFPMFPEYPQVSIMSFNAPFSVQQLATQRPFPGSTGPHTDPGSDSFVYVCVHIYRMCFTDACGPTHSPPATAISFALPRTSSASLPPSPLPPHTQAHIIKVLCIPRGEYNIIPHVV